MTKLQYLNTYLTERLMRTVEDILQVVGQTLSEFQEEINRTKSENQYLKRQLQCSGVASDDSNERGQACPQALWFGNVPPPTEQQHCEQDWSPSVHQEDAQPPQIEEGLNLRTWKDEEQDQEPPPDTGNIDITTALCGSTNNDNNTAQPSQLDHTTERDFQITDQIKAEPHREGYEQPNSISNAEPLAPINAHSSRSQNERNGRAEEIEHHSNERHQEEHLIPVHSNSHHHCTVCRKSFPSPRYLKRHMRSHTKLISSHCGVCGKSFSSYGKLKEHQRLHTGERPFCCDFCGKRFNQNCNLKVHLRVHTGEKPYTCPVCGKGFSQSSQVKMHLRTHR